MGPVLLVPLEDEPRVVVLPCDPALLPCEAADVPVPRLLPCDDALALVPRLLPCVPDVLPPYWPDVPIWLLPWLLPYWLPCDWRPNPD